MGSPFLSLTSFMNFYSQSMEKWSYLCIVKQTKTHTMENNFTLSDYTKAINTIEKIENLRKAAKEASDKYEEAEEKIHKEECSIAERDEFLKCYEEERIADRKLLRAMRSFNRKYDRFCTLRLFSTQKEDEVWVGDVYANIAMNIANDFAQYMINYRFTK